MMTPAETRTNANRVPMLTRFASSESGTTAASTATPTPVMIVIRYGVPNRGWTFAKGTGSRPSRDIANSTRACPSISTSTTVVSPATAPSEISFDAHAASLALNASANGAAVFIRSSEYLSMPVTTNETST